MTNCAKRSTVTSVWSIQNASREMRSCGFSSSSAPGSVFAEPSRKSPAGMYTSGITSFLVYTRFSAGSVAVGPGRVAVAIAGRVGGAVAGPDVVLGGVGAGEVITAGGVAEGRLRPA